MKILNNCRWKLLYLFLIIGLGVVYFLKMSMGYVGDEAFSLIFGKMNTSEYYISFAEQFSLMQMAGWFISPFISLYIKITGGTTGLILFMRGIWFVIQLIFAVFVYFEFSYWWGEIAGISCSLISLMFYFSYPMLGYKSQLFWSVLGLILCLLHYERTRKMRWVIVSAILFMWGGISYITLFLLIIPISIHLKKRYGNLQIIIFYTACLFLGILSIAYILSGCTIKELLFTISNNLGIGVDIEVVSMENRGLFPAIKRLVEVLGVVVITSLPLVVLKHMIHKRVDYQDKLVIAATIYYIALIILLCLLRIQTVSVSRFYYAFLCLFGWGYIITDAFCIEKSRVLVQFIYKMSIWTMLAISFATMQGLAIVAPGCIFGIMAIVICVAQHIDKKSWIVFLIVVLISVFVPFGILVSDSDRAGTILTKRVTIKEGIAKGICVREDFYNEYMEIQHLLYQYSDKNDSLMILAENEKSQFIKFGYLISDSRIGSYTLTDVDNIELLQEFYKMFPSKTPTVIFTYSNYDGEEMLDWIKINYKLIYRGKWLIWKQ